MTEHGTDQSILEETKGVASDGTPGSAGRVAKGTTVDAEEVAFFARISETWWDPTGPFKPLHKLNPARLGFLRDTFARHYNLPLGGNTPLQGLRILDIGCGGGLVAEPVSNMGAEVLGVDASEKNVKTAAHHARETGASVTYRHATAEQLVEEGQTFDAVINLEVVEHVADVQAYLDACTKLVKPGGIMIVSTINRTARALVFAIFMAEYVLGWLPKGAHDWNKFITPDELKGFCRTAGLSPQAASGFVYNPLFDRWSISESDVSMNYLLPTVRPQEDAL